MRATNRLLVSSAIVAAAWLVHAGLEAHGAGAAEPRWWRGNTHTHTLWSDGDGAPEQVVDWYREHGYHFLVLSDHNVLSRGERWFGVEEGGRLDPERVERLVERFGAEAVDLRDGEDGREMRLVTLPELRERFEVPGAFLLVEGEEVTDGLDGLPVHVNGLNLVEPIPPQGGATVREMVQRNVSAIVEQGRRLGRPTLAHVNHPNFGWGLTWEDVAALRDDRFFEVYNGHPSVRNAGDAEHPGTERLWDLALTRRLLELDLGLLYAVATDDAHHYHETGAGRANAGRGWIVVRADALSPEALLGALGAGDFYASSGVSVDDFGAADGGYRVDVAAEPGVTYRTRFVGTRVVDGVAGEVGAVLHETTDVPAEYRFTGDELYVRAVVVSDRPHPNPYAAGDLETAWLQPALGPAAP
jgi:hypothetical protein